MKKNLSILLALFLGSFSLFSQNYDFNNYKYRFQKVRGFETRFENYNSMNNNNENLKRNNDSFKTSRGEKNNFKSFHLNTGFTFFQYINTDKLQQAINFHYGKVIYLFQSNNDSYDSADYSFNNYNYNYNDEKSNSYKNQRTQNELSFNISNSFYKKKNFNYINFYTTNRWNKDIDIDRRIFENSNRAYTNTKTESESRQNQHRLDLEFGFGSGRLEYVTDAIMATFLVKDLMKKADVEELSNRQIENIAKGITQIRNTRFLDFRFRLIDQIEMLDDVLKQNGVTTEKVSKYYTTLNDNWLYATRFQRLSGSQWTYYIKSENNFNIRKQKNQNTYYYGSDSINSSYRKEYDHTLKNGIEIDYTKSKQKSLTVQKSKGFNVFLFNQLYKENYNVEYKGSNSATIIYDDSIQKKSYNILCQFNWNYFYQPNTRTYFDFGINPGFQLQQITLDERDKFSLSEDNFKSEAFLNLNLRYFRFISPRLSFSVNANTYSNLSINNYKIKNDGNFGLDSKVFVNTIRNNMNFGASVSYFIF